MALPSIGAALVAAACVGPGVGGSQAIDSVASSDTIPPTTFATTMTLAAVPVPGTMSSTTMTTAGVTTPSGPPGAVCDRFAPPEAVGVITEEDLGELSGVAASRRYAGLLWAHNDSGNPAQVWALDPTGSVGARIGLPVENVDWEDIALGRVVGGPDRLHLADTGDNRLERSGVDLYRFAEPPPADRELAPGEVERLQLRYEGGPIDVEALFVDPDTGDAYLISKQVAGDALLFLVPSSAWQERTAEAVQVGAIDLGLADLVTGADISPDGTIIAVRTYTRVMLWGRDPGTPIPEVMGQVPCDLPPPEESQGEGITIGDDGIFTVGEGVGALLHRYASAG